MTARLDEFQQELLPLIPNLTAFARSLCRSRDWAEDLVQETILRAWANRDRYQPKSNMKAWLFTILRNHFFNEVRKRKNGVVIDLGSPTFDVSVRESQSSSLQLIDVAGAFKHLSKDQREALTLVGVNELSYEESAKICNCPVGTIKSRVARARQALEKRCGGPELESSSALFA